MHLSQKYSAKISFSLFLPQNQSHEQDSPVINSLIYSINIIYTIENISLYCWFYKNIYI